MESYKNYEKPNDFAKLDFKTDVATKIDKNFCSDKTLEGKHLVKL